ncbi:C40 family peptidase [Bacillus sp. S/N-304-OC-R1]|uniref:C40 family peptidase n=1 Tax=Bacillus sp. S/N-304-OC-R1 TaxID=2758034 RepID=UPI001C8E668C|nr:LysM peptidoglycan-binding domain-containing C40 family peptidase [Bacillus sp. S/N-304-OC-R1]MBY0120569.1 LysM peptidoglycan-binding domain-containing C40 family peptidase [Bacillus sp. S/N-304-OC-R1]
MRKQLLTMTAAAGLFITAFQHPASAHEMTYQVRTGDTLWKIAQANNLSVNQLSEWNKLIDYVIYPGQKLIISGSVISKVDALVTEAKKYIGVPYVWGGSTPAGFDCSGYLNYVFNNVGIAIPRTVLTIWNATKPVSSLKIGDIVFYNTTDSGPSHAGIYLGDNKFIHSGSSTGVTISDMNLAYWKTRYLGARTPF